VSVKDQTLRQIVAAFPGRSVLIVGDVMLDEYVWGETRRISAEAPVPIVEVQRRTYLPGGAGNAAANVVSLQGRALLGGVVGADEPARRLREALQERAIDARGLVVDAARPTTTKTRVIIQHQQVARMDHERRQPLSEALEEQLLGWVEQALPRADVCVISDYAKGVVSARVAQRFIGLARRAGKPVVVDPKGADYQKYRGAAVVKPNIHETERILKTEIETESDLLSAGHQLAVVLEGTAILITRGPKGISLFRAGEDVVHIPSVARTVYDVTGAGDTVVGTLALALAAGAGLDEAAQLANQAAGIVVGKVGTATVTIDEWLAEMG
jgi:D-glycero-beta-D-manno-heptose-7-phosphate kinase